MNPQDERPGERERTQVAAAWWLRLQEDEAAGFSAAFREWIADSANEREFQAIELAAETLRQSGMSAPITAMRRSAREWFADKGRSRRFSRKMVSALAAALLLSLGGGAYYLWSAARPLSYRTAVGERRAVALGDGSRILLDSDSEVDVRYSKAARAIVLARGRARFDVAHDVARPFSVAAGAETVVAVGTSFDVELRGSEVLVTLIHGRVLIKGAPAGAPRPPAPVRLSAGQQLVASAGLRPVVAPADFAVTQAWENGHLVFRGERLADAVAQINRYTDHPIAVDPSAASFRVSGVFNTGDTKSFISAATEFFPIEAVADADGTITLRRSP